MNTIFGGGSANLRASESYINLHQCLLIRTLSQLLPLQQMEVARTIRPNANGAVKPTVVEAMEAKAPKSEAVQAKLGATTVPTCSAPQRVRRPMWHLVRMQTLVQHPQSPRTTWKVRPVNLVMTRCASTVKETIPIQVPRKGFINLKGVLDPWTTGSNPL